MQLMQMLQGSQNPMSLIQNILGSNPQFQRVMQMVNGKSTSQMEQIARNLCQQGGINFDSAVDNMRKMGLNIPQTINTSKNGK